MIAVRAGRPEDRAAIRAIHEAAFGRPDEADLVDALRAEGAILASLVAEIDGRAIGHILFTRMWIDTDAGALEAVALAPMAVLPDCQRKGIGGRLIREGLEVLRGERIVIVLGHREYYPKFGFTSELARALENPFPPGALMAMEMEPGALAGVRGRVRYARSFDL